MARSKGNLPAWAYDNDQDDICVDILLSNEGIDGLPTDKMTNFNSVQLSVLRCRVPGCQSIYCYALMLPEVMLESIRKGNNLKTVQLKNGQSPLSKNAIVKIPP